MRYVISKNTGGMTYKYLCINSNSGFIACGEFCISYMLQLIGAESLPASVLYPFITGGSIILTSFAGVAFLKRKTHNSSMDGCYGVLCRNIIISIGEKRYEKKCI